MLDELNRETRLMTTFSALYGQAVAEQLGIGHTDMESLDFLNLFGPMTAGRLSELTGLSSGATTRLIDRLEGAGYVRRTRDPNDRRRVIIEPVAEKGPGVFRYFAPIGMRMSELWRRYEPEQIELIVDYLRRSNAIMAEENARIRREAETAAADASAAAG